MTDEGVVLYSYAHPRPVWWKRPYWWIRCWYARRVMSKYIITEEITINENEEELK